MPRRLPAKEMHNVAEPVFSKGKCKVKRIANPLFIYMRISISTILSNDTINTNIQFISNTLEAQFRRNLFQYGYRLPYYMG